MKKLFCVASVTIAFILFDLTANGQSTINGKVISYLYFIDEEELLTGVLSQSNMAVKSRKCSVVVTDSTFNKRADVKAKTVKENFFIAYNSNGQPLELNYEFSSNKVSLSSKVPFVYSGQSTYIVATNTLIGPFPMPTSSCYLYQNSADGRYLAQTVWMGRADTTEIPTSRDWVIKNGQGIDSIIVQQTSFMKSQATLTSNVRSAGKSVCKYTTVLDMTEEEFPKETLKEPDGITEYFFNENGQIIKQILLADQRELATITWAYDDNQRLIDCYVVNTLETRFEHYTIRRDVNGKPAQVHIMTTEQSLLFDFTWK